jgi:uncharacterized protein YhbP (UPF0306 family)
MKVNFKQNIYDNDALNASIFKILESTKLWSMSSINNNQTSHINTAFFCYNDNLHLYYLSSPSSQHSKNITNNKSIGVSIFNTEQIWGEGTLRGLQIFGLCEMVKKEDIILANQLYSNRFPAFADWISTLNESEKNSLESKFYCVIPHKIKLFDEQIFGEETYIDLNF